MRKFLLLVLLVLPALCFSEDYMWWNLKHGWEPWMPGWRSFIRITPGYLGPNALPVPEVKKGVVLPGSAMEVGFSSHFREGDPTQDIFAKYYRSFANNKIAIEIYGVVVEHYAMTEFVRDERFARDFDGKGIANGDLYFSTLIQLVKGRRFPDTMVRMAGRTASGSQLEGARYSDSPGYFFDFSFSKEYQSAESTASFQPFASFGFYSWQTNDLANLQNDALMYGTGADVKWSKWSISNSVSGYSGYKKERDKPMVYSFDLNRKLKNKTIRIQYIHGLSDWTYKTLKASVIFDLKR
ncbi:MAG: hypothetical protein JNK09_06500 [Prolixibacteraceae bacterium]|nr:hypothetical protein [Prolixibacteraceae bacterium]